MPNGFGRGGGGGGGFGLRGGMGFGFRGSSPPWPYVGIGRGGLPRHEYFLNGAAGTPAQWPYQQAPYPASPGFGIGQSSYPPYAATSPAFGNTPFTKEQELDFLRNQAETIGEQLEQIETRMRDLESENKKSTKGVNYARI
jgi:hypothetical protein